MKFKILTMTLSFFITMGANAATIIIDANQGTQNQVNQANPGDTLLFSPGNHDDIDFHDYIATECNPTVIMSLDPNNPGVFYSNIPGHPALDVENCKYLIIENMVSTMGQTGIDIKLSEHVIIRDCEIRYTGNAGLKIRYRSRYVDFIDNAIHHTGRVQPQYGEGIYLGTAKAKGWEPWGPPAGGDAEDTLSYIWIEGNEIYECGNGEGIDFKSDIKHVTVKGNHIHDIYPGVENGQANEAAISVAGGRDNPDQPGEFWIEENTIEDVFWGAGTPGGNNVHGAGITTFGGGHYILNNTLGDCVEGAIRFKDLYYRQGWMSNPYFIYEHGNTINNNTGPDYTGPGDLGPFLHQQHPGFSNPYSKQSWCGDPQNSCSIPDLGADQSICGQGTINLNSGVTPNGVSTFEWFLDGVSQGSPSTTANTRSVIQGGDWSVVIDSLGACSNSDEVTIDDEIDPFDLGPDEDLCSTLTLDLTAGTNNPSFTYSWTRNSSNLGLSTYQITISEDGVYEATVSALGCIDVTDQITITSSLPQGTNDTICSAGIANLTSNASGSAEWYDAQTNGNLMHTGASYSPSIATSSTYFLQDGSGAVNHSTGHTAFSSAWADATYDRKIKFVVDQELTINEVSFDASGAQTVNIRILASDNSTVVAQYSKPVSDGVDQISLGITLAPGTYFMDGEGTTGSLYLDDGVTSYAGVAGVISFDTEPNWEAGLNRWRYFYNWQISVGGACARIPVEAIIDQGHWNCTITSVDDSHSDFIAYPNPTDGLLKFDQEIDYQIINAVGRILKESRSSVADLSEFPKGVYILRSSFGIKRIVLN